MCPPLTTATILVLSFVLNRGTAENGNSNQKFGARAMQKPAYGLAWASMTF
jgi:hypothetical protein